MEKILATNEHIYFGNETGEEYEMYNSSMELLSDNHLAEQSYINDLERIASKEIEPIYISDVAKYQLENM